MKRRAFWIEKLVNIKAHLVCGRGLQRCGEWAVGQEVGRRTNYSIFKEIKVTTDIIKHFLQYQVQCVIECSSLFTADHCY